MEQIIDWQDGFVKISKKDLENLLKKAGIANHSPAQQSNVLKEVNQNMPDPFDEQLQSVECAKNSDAKSLTSAEESNKQEEPYSQLTDFPTLEDVEVKELKSYYNEFWFNKEKVSKEKKDLTKYWSLPQIVSTEKENPDEVKIKVYLKKQSLYLGVIPSTFEELKAIITSKIKSSKKIPVDPEDIEMFFIDQDKEKWMIEEYSDFTSGMIYAENQESKIFRIVIKVSRDNGRESDGRYHTSEDESEEEHDRQDEIEKFELISEDTDKTLIMREGYVYRQFYVGSTGKVAFYWDDKKKNNWSGRWEINRFITGDDYGRL